MKKRNLFITFEGTEGSGKSTQIKRAAVYLKKKGLKVLLLREPGGTRVSEAIREVILDKTLKEMTSETELLLYLAARAQIIKEKIRPALEKGVTVICDRFEDSTLAYQGFGRGFQIQRIEALSQWLVRGSLKPDMTFLLDIDPRLGMKRGGRQDRIERESLVFHRKVRQGFLKLAAKHPRRFVVMDALQSRDAIAQKIKERLDHELG